MRERARIGWTVAATSFGFALVQLDVTIVNVALPPIAKALGTDTAGLQWIIDAYALVFAALLLSAGFLGDRFGAKRIYLAGLALFAAASLACGLALGPVTLILARSVQGMGAAAMLPCSLTLLNHAVADDKPLRAKAIGWWTASGSITIAAGPIVGGLLLGVSGWRSVFLVNLPICALAALMALRVEETPRRGGKQGFDLLGQGLGMAAMGALTAAVIEAKPLGLTNPFVLTAAAIGAACAGAFILVERRSPAPMLPLGLFQEPSFGPALLFGVVVNLTYYGMVFVLSLYLQRALGYGPVKAGLAYLPLTATFFVVNLFSGWWVGRAGSRTPMIVGALIDACGFALLLLLTVHSPYGLLVPAFALMPAGMGLGVPAMTTAVLAGVDKSLSGVASGVLNAARQAGGAIGVAIFGALASGGGAEIVNGLHKAAVIAIILLLLAGAIAALGVRPPRENPHGPAKTGLN